uniref:Uncharacterized protein n=1 Tax=Arundo donax TaxID=35708 RepID=A0A0A9FRL6_ARUDO
MQRFYLADLSCSFHCIFKPVPRKLCVCKCNRKKAYELITIEPSTEVIWLIMFRHCYR